MTSQFVRDVHIVLQRWIDFVSSRVALNGTHVEIVTDGVQAILKGFLIASFPDVFLPCLLRPLLHFRVVVMKKVTIFPFHLLHRLLEMLLE